MDSKIRQPENWLEQQQSLLDAYIERVFASESIDAWSGTAPWYVDAISTLFGSNLKRTQLPLHFEPANWQVFFIQKIPFKATMYCYFFNDLG